MEAASFLPIASAVVLLATTACDRQQRRDRQPDSPDCEVGWIADGDRCVPEACGTGTWGNLPVDGATVYVDITAD